MRVYSALAEVDRPGGEDPGFTRSKLSFINVLCLANCLPLRECRGEEIQMKNRFFKVAGTVVAGLVLAATTPDAAMAEEHGGHRGDGHYERGNERHYDGGRREYHGGGRDYYRGGDHDRRYRGGYYYGGGGYSYGGPSVYLGFGAPAYAYNSGCGYYDAYGYWHADPGCYYGY